MARFVDNETGRGQCKLFGTKSLGAIKSPLNSHGLRYYQRPLSACNHVVHPGYKYLHGFKTATRQI